MKLPWSAKFLYQILGRVALEKKGIPGAEGQPFGGVKVIFSSNIGQPRPVGSSASKRSLWTVSFRVRNYEKINGMRIRTQGIWGILDGLAVIHPSSN